MCEKHLTEDIAIAGHKRIAGFTFYIATQATKRRWHFPGQLLKPEQSQEDSYAGKQHETPLTQNYRSPCCCQYLLCSNRSASMFGKVHSEKLPSRETIRN